MVENIDRRCILCDSDVIKVCSEEYIDIDNNDLPAPDNLLVVVQQESAHSIFECEFFQNGLCYRSMDQCMNTRAYLPPGITGGVNVIPA